MIEILEREILEGKYKFNEKLPGIPQLAKRFKVSYGTAHAAVTKLAKKQLLLIEPGKGTYVIGDRPIGIEWLWFTGGKSLHGSLIYDAVSFLTKFWMDEKNDKITLNLNLFDVRNLPSPKTLIKISRERGIRGMLVSGHGKFFIDYINELCEGIPVVSLFGNWKGQKFSFVAPDTDSLINEVLAKWSLNGVKTIGFSSPPLDNHPNYMNLFELLNNIKDKYNIVLDKQNCFCEADSDITLNWMIGRLSRPDAPKYWVTSVIGHCISLMHAAETLKLVVGKDIHILTFSMCETDYEKFDRKVNVGVHQIQLSIENGIEYLSQYIWQPPQDKNSLNKYISVPYKIMYAEEQSFL